MNPLVSIIIPIYNSEQFIYDTVKSCIDQTYQNLEIILVNDGSTDGTEDIIKLVMLVVAQQETLVLQKQMGSYINF